MVEGEWNRGESVVRPTTQIKVSRKFFFFFDVNEVFTLTQVSRTKLNYNVGGPQIKSVWSNIL